MKFLSRLFWRPFHRSREEVAGYIEDFLLGKGGDWDWDDFLSIPLDDDPYLEGIRLKCGDLRDEYPPAPGVRAYCNEEGFQVLRDLLAELRGDNSTESQPGA